MQNENFVGDIKLIIPLEKSVVIGTKISGYSSVLKRILNVSSNKVSGSCVAPKHRNKNVGGAFPASKRK